VPTLNQLEARIDEALVIARASEEGLREMGEMALDAARQARRAAVAAEASATAAAAISGPASSDPERQKHLLAMAPGLADAASRRPAENTEVRLRSFNKRADRLLARAQAV
jgi:hypothetical protein